MRLDNLKGQQNNFRAAVQAYVQKSKANDWGHDKICVRNFTPSAQVDPRREILALLVRLTIPVAPEEIEIVGCFELATEPGKYQIIIAFTNVSTKIELMSKQEQLTRHENSAINRLRLVDVAETFALYKRANAKLKVKSGVDTIKMSNGQILVKIRPNEPFVEIISDEQIEPIVEKIKELGKVKKLKNRKAKPPTK